MNKSENGYFGGRSRLARQFLLKEGEPLAPELDRYNASTVETMDSWLDDDIKELLCAPCLRVADGVAKKLNSRLEFGQNRGEPSLTEDFLDWFSTDSRINVWGNVISLLEDKDIYIQSRSRKSTYESEYGADVGIYIYRQTHSGSIPTQIEYACLVQAKKVNNEGVINDFFHEVGGSGDRQSDMMLSVTPSSFYFVYVPTDLVSTYSNLEPIAFADAGNGCTSAVWNMGSFQFDDGLIPALTNKQKSSSAGILVVPALAVEAQDYDSKDLSLEEIIPNCIPFWYWFSELLIPAFIGDRSERTLSVATNSVSEDQVVPEGFGVRNELEISITNG